MKHTPQPPAKGLLSALHAAERVGGVCVRTLLNWRLMNGQKIFKKSRNFF